MAIRSNHLVKNMFYFPLLVLKGVYHYTVFPVDFCKWKKGTPIDSVEKTGGGGVVWVGVLLKIFPSPPQQTWHLSKDTSENMKDVYLDPQTTLE